MDPITATTYTVISGAMVAQMVNLMHNRPAKSCEGCMFFDVAKQECATYGTPALARGKKCYEYKAVVVA